MGAARTVSPRLGIADIAVIVFPLGQTVEDVALVEYLGPLVGKVSATRSLDREHGPYLRRAHAQLLGDRAQTVGGKSAGRTLKRELRHTDPFWFMATSRSFQKPKEWGVSCHGSSKWLIASPGYISKK